MTSGVQLSGVGGAEVLPYPFLKIEKRCTDFGKKTLVVCIMGQFSHLKGCFKSILEKELVNSCFLFTQ